jgi:hypothetical protein
MTVHIPTYDGAGQTAMAEADDEPPQRAAADAPASVVRAVGATLFLSPEQVVRRALVLSSAHQEDLISVAGPDGLAAMICLCREGFERVECARQATCIGADEASDLLLIVGPMTAGALADTLHRTARLLRDDGLLIVQLAGAAQEAAIRPALASCGLASGFTLVDRAAGRLVMHRVSRVASLRKAG